MHKNISLFFDDYEIELANEDGLLSLGLTVFELDEEKTKPGHEVYKSKNNIHLYIDPNELNQIMKAIQYILDGQKLD